MRIYHLNTKTYPEVIDVKADNMSCYGSEPNYNFYIYEGRETIHVASFHKDNVMDITSDPTK